MAVILFDGVCNFCNGTINFIIDRDKKKVFVFSALQSAYAQALLKQYNLPLHPLLSIYVVTDKGVFDKSDAIIAIFKELEFVWPLSYLLMMVPKKARDRCYEYFARQRYLLAGKKNSCRVPTPDLRTRFIS